SDVLTKSTPLEAKYAIRLILEVMRVGVAQGTLRDALLWAYFPPITFIYTLEENQYKPVLISTKDALKESDEEGAIHIESIDQLPSDVSNIPIITTPDEKIAREVYNHFSACIQHALDVTNDFGLVTTLAAEQNTDELTKIVPDGSAPLQVMLAKKAKSTTEAFEMVGKPAQLEYKYDGFRIQIHKKDNEIKLFTRRLENVTKQFPEVVDYVRDYIKGDSFILDSEAVGYDPKAKKYMPFQKVSQRIRRKYDIEKLQKELPVEVLVFDVIMHNGENWLDKVLTERRKLLESIIQEQPQKVRCSIKTITDSEEEANTFYAASLAAGNEGLMFKSLDSVYKPGSRVGHMVKLKPIMDTLDLVVVGAQWGEGKRASFLTSFTLACIDDTGQLLTIGKVGTGFKELEGEGVSFAYMTEMLKPLIIKDLGKEVEVKPKLVLEIAYEEIQKSPSYKSGFALRFPRLVQVHETRDVNSASSLDVVESYFEGQNEN
ncbi:MAG: DNA ligase-1, partial [Candidatus Woesearchaeota archaeon]